MTTKHYVLGLLFGVHDEFTTPSILLIQKSRPAWQAGRFNGLGGKVEPDEQCLAALKREFKEECGLDSDELKIPWQHFVTLEGEEVYDPKYPGRFTVWMYAAKVPRDVLDCARSLTDEKVAVHSVESLPPRVPNLEWLIPMARVVLDGRNIFEGRGPRRYVVTETI